MSELKIDREISDFMMAHAKPERKIVTSHIFPPIPIRDYDWCAYFDDVGADCSPHGWGATEAEAKADLLDNYGESDMRLPDR